jgi:hypothetical protein
MARMTNGREQQTAGRTNGREWRMGGTRPTNDRRQMARMTNGGEQQIVGRTNSGMSNKQQDNEQTAAGPHPRYKRETVGLFFFLFLFCSLFSFSK